MLQILMGGFSSELQCRLERQLKGACVRRAGDGEEIFRDLPFQSEISLLILDHRLENPPALEILKNIRAGAGGRDLPVIYCLNEGSGAELVKRLVKEYAVQGVMLPPLDAQELAWQAAGLLGLSLNSATAEENAFQAAILESRNRFLDTMGQRLEVLEQAGTALLEKKLTLPLRAAAEREAHKLAGTLGTIGFAAGSRFAREIEELLRAGVEVSEAQSLRVSELIVALRLDLERSSSSSTGLMNTPSNQTLFLIVDRTQELAGQLVAGAAAKNWELKTVHDLTAARSAVLEHTPDLVLLDPHVSGNGEDGLAFLQELSSRSPSIPVMVLASQDTFTDRLEVARRGGRGFLSKSSPASKIAEAAFQLLSRLHAEDHRILAVDDDPQVLSFLRSLLEPRGWRIDTLEDPLQFWERLEANAPDLLLLDVDMPHLSGVELCRVVRNDPRWAEIPILFLTGHNDPETIDRVFSAGADDFVPKPVVGPELLTRVSNRLEQSRLRKSMMETDYLTGALNRAKFSKTLSGFLDLARLNNQPVAFALIEIDQLKEIDHAHGHGAGDAVLERAGLVLREAFRGEDVFGRWNGGRFAAGMYGLARYDAVQRLNELAEKMSDERFKAAGGVEFAVTVSAGVAEYDEDGNDLESLFRAAEGTLAGAQNSGGKKVLPVSCAAGAENPARQLDVALMVKDEARSSLLINALERLGCRARWFRDGRKAVKLLSGAQPAIHSKVILLDVELPGMDGLAVLKRLACDGVLARTRVIMLTAPSVHNEAQIALELGAFDCMVKPFNPPVAVQHIRRALSHSE